MPPTPHLPFTPQSAHLVSEIQARWDKEVNDSLAAKRQVRVHPHFPSLPCIVCGALSPALPVTDTLVQHDVAVQLAGELEPPCVHGRVCTGQPVFRTAFLATFRRTVAIVTGFLIVKHAIQLLQTQFLAHLLRFLLGSTKPDSHGWVQPLYCSLLAEAAAVRGASSQFW